MDYITLNEMYDELSSMDKTILSIFMELDKIDGIPAFDKNERALIIEYIVDLIINNKNININININELVNDFVYQKEYWLSTDIDKWNLEDLDNNIFTPLYINKSYINDINITDEIECINTIDLVYTYNEEDLPYLLEVIKGSNLEPDELEEAIDYYNSLYIDI